VTERAKVLREVADRARSMGTLGFFAWLHREVERSAADDQDAGPLDSLNTDMLRQEHEEAQ
jgi:hypothetical protein